MRVKDRIHGQLGRMKKPQQFHVKRRSGKHHGDAGGTLERASPPSLDKLHEGDHRQRNPERKPQHVARKPDVGCGPAESGKAWTIATSPVAMAATVNSHSTSANTAPKIAVDSAASRMVCHGGKLKTPCGAALRTIDLNAKLARIRRSRDDSLGTGKADDGPFAGRGWKGDLHVLKIIRGAHAGGRDAVNGDVDRRLSRAVGTRATKSDGARP